MTTSRTTSALATSWLAWLGASAFSAVQAFGAQTLEPIVAPVLQRPELDLLTWLRPLDRTRLSAQCCNSSRVFVRQDAMVAIVCIT